MLHYETVDRDTLDLLKHIQSNPHFSDIRLVGGTALALQIGHRKSIDLDFFVNTDLDCMDMSLELQAFGNTAVRSSSKLTQRYLVRGIQVDFVRYEYPWLEEPVESDGLRLAHCRDIAAMKLAAITNRGTRKDFIDLDFLLAEFTLNEMLTFYTGKFKDGSRFNVLKSLVFFDDAEEDPMPHMIKRFDWPAAKKRIEDAVAGLAVEYRPPL